MAVMGSVQTTVSRDPVDIAFNFRFVRIEGTGHSSPDRSMVSLAMGSDVAILARSV